jgi:serine/threonine protein kinase
MPNIDQYDEKKTLENVFRQEDPSSFYEVLEPIGKGGSSKIFKVRRLADQKICCLKYMKPNDDFEKELIIDEVAILKFNPGDCIISL